MKGIRDERTLTDALRSALTDAVRNARAEFSGAVLRDDHLDDGGES